MTKKVKLSKKDSLLVVLGILISFMIQSLFDAVHEGLNILGTSDMSQFISSLIAFIAFMVLVFVLFSKVEET